MTPRLPSSGSSLGCRHGFQASLRLRAGVGSSRLQSSQEAGLRLHGTWTPGHWDLASDFRGTQHEVAIATSPPQQQLQQLGGGGGLSGLTDTAADGRWQEDLWGLASWGASLRDSAAAARLGCGWTVGAGPVVASERRIFGQRGFRLWVEDYPSCGGARVHAMDEAARGRAYCDLTDAQLSEMFADYKRNCCHSGNSSGTEAEVDDFLRALLDAVSIEAVAGGGLWLRLPSSLNARAAPQAVPAPPKQGRLAAGRPRSAPLARRPASARGPAKSILDQMLLGGDADAKAEMDGEGLCAFAGTSGASKQRRPQSARPAVTSSSCPFPQGGQQSEEWPSRPSDTLPAGRRRPRPTSAKALKHRRVVDDGIDSIIYEDVEEDSEVSTINDSCRAASFIPRPPPDRPTPVSSRPGSIHAYPVAAPTGESSFSPPRPTAPPSRSAAGSAVAWPGCSPTREQASRSRDQTDRPASGTRAEPPPQPQSAGQSCGLGQGPRASSPPRRAAPRPHGKPGQKQGRSE
mmetsp:Transcript_56938/g.123221  ORF Transcript_56938/g.123221 Transcript_56938/m.123221 type:complete len:517 (-) Transcript_56938:150-1700(-)